jgi:integrase
MPSYPAKIRPDKLDFFAGTISAPAAPSFFGRMRPDAAGYGRMTPDGFSEEVITNRVCTLEADMGAIKSRTLASGKRVFDAEVKKRGFPRTARTFERLGDARTWIQDVESRMRSRRFVPDAEFSRHTLGEAIDRYIVDELSKKPKTTSHQKTYLVWFKQQLGCKKLCDVTPAALSESKSVFLREITYRKTHRAPHTWNRYASALSCVFRLCCSEWQWMAENPFRRMKKEKEPPGRVRFLTDEERGRLLEACRQSRARNLYLMVVLALSTGMRRGEIRPLTWDDVDLKTGVIILQSTKNGERRRVPVRDLALELLREHAKVRRLDCSLVFPGSLNARTPKPFDPRDSFDEALRRAGIKDFRFHDLRHATASYLAMNGASLLEIAEVLGHKTLQMVKRYSHLAESHTAMVVESMNKKIFRR